MRNIGAHSGPDACRYKPKCVVDGDGGGDCNKLYVKKISGNRGQYNCNAHNAFLRE